MGPTRVRLSAPDEDGVQVLEHLEATPVDDGHLSGQMMQFKPQSKNKSFQRKEARRKEKKGGQTARCKIFFAHEDLDVPERLLPIPEGPKKRMAPGIWKSTVDRSLGFCYVPFAG